MLVVLEGDIGCRLKTLTSAMQSQHFQDIKFFWDNAGDIKYGFYQLFNNNMDNVNWDYSTISYEVWQNALQKIDMSKNDDNLKYHGTLVLGGNYEEDNIVITRGCNLLLSDTKDINITPIGMDGDYISELCPRENINKLEPKQELTDKAKRILHYLENDFICIHIEDRLYAPLHLYIRRMNDLISEDSNRCIFVSCTHKPTLEELYYRYYENILFDEDPHILSNMIIASQCRHIITGKYSEVGKFIEIGGRDKHIEFLFDPDRYEHVLDLNWKPRFPRTTGWHKKYEFTADWFDHNIKNWKVNLNKFVGQPVNFLEIGSYEGRSALWCLENILTHDDSRLVMMDKGFFREDGVNTNDVLERNVEQYKDKTLLMRTDSKILDQDLLKWNVEFDFVYVDGSHCADGTYRDCKNALALLKENGILCIDDYEWSDISYDGTVPKTGIDKFLNDFSNEIEVIEKDYQVWIRKMNTISNVTEPTYNDLSYWYKQLKGLIDKPCSILSIVKDGDTYSTWLLDNIMKNSESTITVLCGVDKNIAPDRIDNEDLFQDHILLEKEMTSRGVNHKIKFMQADTSIIAPNPVYMWVEAYDFIFLANINNLEDDLRNCLKLLKLDGIMCMEAALDEDYSTAENIAHANNKDICQTNGQIWIS